MEFIELQSGAKIRCDLIDGRRDRPCLVFLHEGLGCIEMWRDFPRRLCGRLGWQGLVYDRSGYGKSSPEPEKRTVSYLHAAAAELAQVISTLIPAQEYLLIGHSDGGSIALIHGAAGDPFLKGIVTEAAHVFVEEETVIGIEETVEKYGPDGPRGLGKYHGERAADVFRAWWETWLSGVFRSWNIESLLPAVTCPVLAVQGREDEFGTENQVQAIITRVSGPAESCLMPACGHRPHLEHPEQVLGKMAEFLSLIAENSGKEQQ